MKQAVEIENKHLFSKSDLKKLLIPLMIEQLLNSMMGMVDTVMVSNVGSAAISAVSLVDSINVLVIQLLSALAVGGTIVCSQYLGRKDAKGSNNAARQVLLSTVVISIVMAVFCILFCHPEFPSILSLSGIFLLYPRGNHTRKCSNPHNK